MYFPVIKKALGSAEEKAFYSTAVLYLETLGYTGLSIVDGPGDGGRDVISNRNDLRIQLSVRRDWERKINEEAERTKQAGLKHFIYVTNRAISPRNEHVFLTENYKLAGEVDVSIHDLNRISTSLVRPNSAIRAYELLGLKLPTQIDASLQDVALSSVLLFSHEAKELRKNLIDSTVKAIVFKCGTVSEEELKTTASELLPWTGADRLVVASISRLRTEGEILGKLDSVQLSDAEFNRMQIAEAEFQASRIQDIHFLSKELELTPEKSEKLLDLSLELLVRNADFAASGVREEELREFLADQRLSRNRDKVFNALSRCTSAKLKQHGETLDHICKSNTFDIYRALGRRTNLTIVLDASVAMPIICGLSFGHARSRYGTAAASLMKVCSSHGIKLIVPRSYLNEMAYHGMKALSFNEVYYALPQEAKTALRASGNAYLSHFTHISETVKEEQKKITLEEFLQFFGIRKKTPLYKVENRISSILDEHGITISNDGPYDEKIYKRIAHEKHYEAKILVEHDARVCTLVHSDSDNGYILATWDKVIIELMEDLSRVYADNPARVIDFLSISSGINSDDDVNYDILTSLIYLDERKLDKLSTALEQLKSSDQGYQVQKIIDEARAKKGSEWELSAKDIYPLLDPLENHTD